MKNDRVKQSNSRKPTPHCNFRPCLHSLNTKDTRRFCWPVLTIMSIQKYSHSVPPIFCSPSSLNLRGIGRSYTVHVNLANLWIAFLKDRTRYIYATLFSYSRRSIVHLNTGNLQFDINFLNKTFLVRFSFFTQITILK